MKCPLCGKLMTAMTESPAADSPSLPALRQETLYFCRQHGVMNKYSDLRDKVNQIAKRA